MNKFIVGVIAVLVIGGGIVGAMTIANKDDNPASISQDSADPTNNDTGSLNDGNSAQPPQSTSTDTSQASTNNNVEIKNNAFTPSTITVKKGTKVTWTNVDTVKHDIMPDSESDAFKASELLAKGESYEFTFNTPGTYNYHCTPHPFMKGTVIVTE